jgi:hypothetical protein
MNTFLFDKNQYTAYLYFWADLQGAEIDEAILQACQSYPVEHMLGITNGVIDKRDVQSADLSETDSAQASIFGKISAPSLVLMSTVLAGFQGLQK